MSINFCPLIMWCVLVLLAQSEPKPQEDYTKWTFQGFQNAITSLQISPTTTPDESAQLDEIAKSLGALHDRYVRMYGSDQDNTPSISNNISVEYVKSMNADLSLLQTLPTDHSERLAILKDIQADLVTKVSFVAKSLGVQGTFPATISVTVDTVRSSGQQVSGLWVRCNPQRYGVTTNPLFVFNSASTPTTSTLPPGAFTCWVEDLNHKVLTSQPINLGASGSNTESFKLAVP